MNDAAHPSILVVEDDPAVRNLVTTALDLHGYTVEKATDGETAIMDAASRNPDLIMLDLGLPDIDGVEVINKIRSWSAVPIIVISARVEDSDKIGALDAGADDYLTKPFSVEEMLARVRANLRRSTMITAESIEASTFDNGGLHIDYAAGIRRARRRAPSRSHPPSTSSSCFWRKTSTRCSRTPSSRTRSGGRAGTAISRAYACSCEPCARRSRPTPSHPTMIQTHVGVGYRMQRLEPR